MVDWVSEGRRARGERWGMGGWGGRNEVWLVEKDGEDGGGRGGGEGGGDGEIGGDKGRGGKRGKRTLLVRDAVLLENLLGGKGHDSGRVRAGMDDKGIFGTLLLRGPLFLSLAHFFVSEYQKLKRLGVRDWGDGELFAGEGEDGGKREDGEKRKEEEWRRRRWALEEREAVVWTACWVRGVCVVKFAAGEVGGARAWLGEMVGWEGGVGREFGPGGGMFVR